MFAPKCRFARQFLRVTALFTAAGFAGADTPPPAPAAECNDPAVLEHVVGQYRQYGPQSDKHEYFGFVYRDGGDIKSAVVRSPECRVKDSCRVDTATAAARIPRGAKVLGEWHTHPHQGSRALSADDVRGARNNRHIRCYTPFYSTPEGEIYAWDARQTSVPAAMASREHVGNLNDSSELEQSGSRMVQSAQPAGEQAQE
jgi:hypothetical protein